jgi:hypothetical protein
LLTAQTRTEKEKEIAALPRKMGGLRLRRKKEKTPAKQAKRKTPQRKDYKLTLKISDRIPRNFYFLLLNNKFQNCYVQFKEKIVLLQKVSLIWKIKN